MPRVLDQPLRLRAFADAGRTDEDESACCLPGTACQSAGIAGTMPSERLTIYSSRPS